MAASLDQKVAAFVSMFNEVAIGYNDSGDFWHFQYGPRGAGSMIDGIGERFSAVDGGSLDEAFDALFTHLEATKAAP